MKIINAINLNPRVEDMEIKIWDDLNDCVKQYNCLLSEIIEKEKYLKNLHVELGKIEAIPTLTYLKSLIPPLEAKLVNAQEQLEFENLNTKRLNSMTEEKKNNITIMRIRIMDRYLKLPKLNWKLTHKTDQLIDWNRMFENIAVNYQSIFKYLIILILD